MGLSACRIPQYRTRNINVEPPHLIIARGVPAGLYPLTTRAFVHVIVHRDPAVLQIAFCRGNTYPRILLLLLLLPLIYSTFRGFCVQIIESSCKHDRLKLIPSSLEKRRNFCFEIFHDLLLEVAANFGMN